MCYMNCEYESYPYGQNEGCVCKKRGGPCPNEEEETEEEAVQAAKRGEDM